MVSLQMLISEIVLQVGADSYNKHDISTFESFWIPKTIQSPSSKIDTLRFIYFPSIE